MQAISDFDLSHSTKNSLIIITAGLDTCETEAISQVETLSRRLGIDLDLHLIGLGVADLAFAEGVIQEIAASGAIEARGLSIAVMRYPCTTSASAEDTCGVEECCRAGHVSGLPRQVS